MSEDNILPDDLFLVAVEDDNGEETGKTLSFSRAPTVLLSFAANRFTRNAARFYQREFGIGAMDWRMLVMLTRVPGCSVAQASKTIGIDKGAVSRSLARLQEDGLAEAVCTVPDVRRKEWSLTDQGRCLHDRMLSAALERQRALLDGFSEADVAQFNTYLQRLLENIDEL